MSLNQISNFNEEIQKAYEWIASVAEILDTDKERAFMFIRPVLHTLRDRLTVEEAFDLAAQLPVILKGIYFEGYVPHNKPEKIKTKEEFLNKVMQGLGMVTEEEVEDATDVVIALLEANVSEGEMDDVRGQMPKKLKEMFY